MAWLTRAEAAALTEEQRIDYLAKTVIGEAVGEGPVGMAVVAQVIANRASDGRWPSDPVAVAGQKFQFSTNNPFGYQGGNSDMVNNYGPNTIEYQQARQAVQAAIFDKSLPDITGGSAYYHTTAMGWPASWPASIKQHGFVDIGGHRVYPARPIEPGVIPANLAKVREFGVGSMLDVKQGPAPIRPASLSANLRLQRETNRVAQQRAEAPATIRAARALAFTAVRDPFEIDRASNSNLMINRPEPAMRASMRAELRATGTPQSSARTFAFDQMAARGLDGDSVLRVSQSMGAKPPAAVEAPWGVRQSVAAAVAATDAAAGRGQLVMTGNPNISGAVVDWLYPRVEEGQGEANQQGKGDRARPASIDVQRRDQAIERAGSTPVERTPASQSPATSDQNVRAQADEQRALRSQPRVVVTNGNASVSAPRVNTDTSIKESLLRTSDATDSRVAVSLAADIAAKRLRDQRAATPVSKSSATSDGNIRSAVSEQQQTRQVTPSKAAKPVPKATIPGPNPVAKAADRLPSSLPIKLNTANLVPRMNSVGTMPNFGDLASIGGSAMQIQTAKAPTKIPGQSIIERQPAKTATTPPVATPAKAPTTAANGNVKPTTTPPSTATVKAAAGAPAVKAMAPAPVRAVIAPLPRPAPRPAPAPVANPGDRLAAGSDTLTVSQLQERARDATNQSGDNSVGNQRDAADARSSGEGGRTRRY